MNVSEFTERYPRVFHMAADGSWPSIQEYGLLSTLALVDLYEPTTALADAILTAVRRRSYVLSREGLPDATVRDQLPLKFLRACLLPGTTEQEFLDELNGRVFFWLTAERLDRLLQAKAYRSQAQTILTIDTAQLLDAHPNADIAPYNTGSVHVPTAPPRGRETFQPLERYPFEFWARKRGNSGDAAVELTIPYAVPAISDYVISVERWDGSEMSEVLFAR